MKTAIICLAAGLALAAEGRSIGAEPYLEPPVGYEQYAETGKFPEVVAITRDKPSSRWTMFPAWEHRKVLFRAKSDRSNRQTVELHINLPKPPSRTSSRFERGALYVVSVKHRDVLPLFGEVYAIAVGPGTVVLTRVTKEIPKELRPHSISRTISLADVRPTLFTRQVEGPYDRKSECDQVTIAFHESTGKATIGLKPISIGHPSFQPSRKPLTLEVEEGQALTARDRSYEVLNIAPPQEIDHGSFVGFVELSDEVLEKE